MRVWLQEELHGGRDTDRIIFQRLEIVSLSCSWCSLIQLLVVDDFIPNKSGYSKKVVYSLLPTQQISQKKRRIIVDAKIVRVFSFGYELDI